MNTTLKLALACFAGCLAAYSPAQGPSQDHGWQVRLLPTGTSYKLHQPAWYGHIPLIDWSTEAVDWRWGAASFSTSLMDGLNEEDDYGVPYPLGVTHSGGVKAFFRWEPGPQGKPAPRFVYVMLSAQAKRSTLGGNAHYGSVNNGLGSPVTWSASRQIQAGSLVFKLEGTGVMELPGSVLHADCFIVATDGQPMADVSLVALALGYPYISGNSYFHEDTGNYRRGPGGERVRNLWTPERLIRVDGLLEWKDETFNDEAGWYARPILKAHQSIYESNRIYWRYHGSGECVEHNVYFYPDADWGEISPRMYYGNGRGQASNSFTIFVANVLDRENQSNAPLEIPYEVHWHYPFENWRRFQPDALHWIPTQSRNPEPDTEGCGPGDSYQWDSFDGSAKWIDFNDWVANWAGTGSDFISLPIVAGLVSMVGLLSEQIVEQEIRRHSAAFEIHWGRSTSRYWPNFDPSKKEYYKMTATYMVGKAEHFVEADDYRGNSGYQGAIRKVLLRRDGRTDVWAFFMRNDDTPGFEGGN